MQQAAKPTVADEGAQAPVDTLEKAGISKRFSQVHCNLKAMTVHTGAQVPVSTLGKARISKNFSQVHGILKATTSHIGAQALVDTSEMASKRKYIPQVHRELEGNDCPPARSGASWYTGEEGQLQTRRQDRHFDVLETPGLLFRFTITGGITVPGAVQRSSEMHGKG